MILGMLSHYTLPTCIPANIITVAELLHPQNDVVKDLPGITFVCKYQSKLIVVTKTLAAYQLAHVQEYKQLFTDGTSCGQTAIQNAVIVVLDNGGYKLATLSSGFY